MSRAGGAAHEHLRRVVSLLLGGTGAFLALSLLTTASTPSVLVVAAAAAALVALAGTDRLRLAPLGGPSLLPIRRALAPPLQSGRVTDSPRHPLRPRAPGLV